MAYNYPSKARYEHRLLLVQLSKQLTEEDCKNILFLEGLPKKLKDKDPLEILSQLEERGKTTEDLIRILKDIDRWDVAKLVEDSEVHVGRKTQEKLISSAKAHPTEDVHRKLPGCSGSPLPARGTKKCTD